VSNAKKRRGMFDEVEQVWRGKPFGGHSGEGRESHYTRRGTIRRGRSGYSSVERKRKALPYTLERKKTDFIIPVSGGKGGGLGVKVTIEKPPREIGKKQKQKKKLNCRVKLFLYYARGGYIPTCACGKQKNLPDSGKRKRGSPRKKPLEEKKKTTRAALGKEERKGDE